MGTSGLITNVLSESFLICTLVTDLLVHIHQKEKFALEIATKVASVKEDNKFQYFASVGSG
jgi:hypothetical protein